MNLLPPRLTGWGACCASALLLTVVLGLSCRQEGRRGAAYGEHVEPETVVSASGIEMIPIPGGWFEMGSHSGNADEAPVHRAWVDAFLMDRHEMTQAHYRRLAGTSPFLSGDPSHFKGPHRPVEMVSWDIAALLCNERSRAEGLDVCYSEDGSCDFEASGYRLPSEAEWEYACRAGTGTAYSFGTEARHLGRNGWYGANSAKRTHPVGERRPNGWGLFDMHGNVAEWCNDVYEEDYYVRSSDRNPTGPGDGARYVLRGGAWNSSAEACRSAARVGESPGTQDACFARDAIGFRCVRKAPGDAAGSANAAANGGTP